MRSRLLFLALVTSLAACSSTAPSSTAAGPQAESPSASAAAEPDPASPAAGSPAVTAGAKACLADPTLHVYNPDRLRLLDSCVTVAGTVDLIRSEADGDYHVRIHLDAGQLCAGQDCLNSGNLSQQAGDLVVEPVCEHAITQADAVSACSGYRNTLAVPPVGSHTTVTGPWVLDQDHGWNEIHPAEMFGGQSMPAAPAAPPPPASYAGALAVAITASQYGYVAASTRPGAVCSAQAKLPSGRISTASGLQAQLTAGSDGAVSWTYRTSTSTTPGTGTHTVSCTLGGATASASAPFSVG